MWCTVFAGNSVWSTSERLVVNVLTIGAIQVHFPFLSFTYLTFAHRGTAKFVFIMKLQHISVKNVHTVVNFLNFFVLWINTTVSYSACYVHESRSSSYSLKLARTETLESSQLKSFTNECVHVFCSFRLQSIHRFTKYTVHLHFDNTGTVIFC